MTSLHSVGRLVHSRSVVGEIDGGGSDLTECAFEDGFAGVFTDQASVHNPP